MAIFGRSGPAVRSGSALTPDNACVCVRLLMTGLQPPLCLALRTTPFRLTVTDVVGFIRYLPSLPHITYIHGALQLTSYLCTHLSSECF